MSFDIPKISSLKELMNEIAWSWDYPRLDFKNTEDGGYSLDKLIIEPDVVKYNHDSWVLEEGVFEELQMLIEILNKSDNLE